MSDPAHAASALMPEDYGRSLGELDQLTDLCNQTLTSMRGGVAEWEVMVKTSQKHLANLKASAASGTAFLNSLVAVMATAIQGIGATNDLGVAFKDLLNQQLIVQEEAARVCEALQNFIEPAKALDDRNRKATQKLVRTYEKITEQQKNELKSLGKQTLSRDKKRSDRNTVDPKLLKYIEKATARSKELQAEKRDTLEQLLIEQRRRYCELTGLYAPIVRQEIVCANAAEGIDNLLRHVTELSASPDILPASTVEAVEARLKGASYSPVVARSSAAQSAKVDASRARSNSDPRKQSLVPTSPPLSNRDIRKLFSPPSSAEGMSQMRVPNLLSMSSSGSLPIFVPPPPLTPAPRQPSNEEINRSLGGIPPPPPPTSGFPAPPPPPSSLGAVPPPPPPPLTLSHSKLGRRRSSSNPDSFHHEINT